MQARPSYHALYVRQTEFASGFLQIPPHGGHPCHWLTVPTAKPVADFHRQVIAHAGRILKASHRISLTGLIKDT